MAQAVNRDIFYTTTANEYRYRIECEGMVIYEGKAYSKPNSDTISINISKICRDYLSNDLPVIETENTTYTHEDALKRFVLYHYNEASDVWTAVETYDFLWYYDFTNSIPSVLSDPVNGRSVIGARCLKTTYNGNSVVTSIATSNEVVGCDDEPSVDYGKYFTIEALESGSLNLNYAVETRNLQYRRNGGDWTDAIVDHNISISVNRNDKLEFKGDNINSSFLFSGNTLSFKTYGNIMSLIDSTNFSTLTTLPSGSDFSRLFNSCTGLTDASNLMLPATKLTSSCYYMMFNNCTSLTQAPELPATTLAENCYEGMFSFCANLTTAPELPATTAPKFCYYMMFNNCTSLTQAPVLPATTVANFCYADMFYGCTSLTTAPSVLPATTLAPSCYYDMFVFCSGLTSAPELPATTLANNCYGNMFNSCSGLTTAPSILPATTLAEKCYFQMFQDCTSLTTAPELPATTLVLRCYQQMFYGCYNLKYIKCLATDISATNCTAYWVYNVAATGTFVKAASMTGWSEGASGIPTNWTVTNGTASQYHYTNNSVSSTNVTTSSNTNVSNINGYVVCKCGDYALYYLNRRGGWDTFVFEGNNKRTDAYDIYKYSKVYDNNGIGFGSMRYHNNVTERYELNTGWLTEDEAMRFAKHLCSTNNAYLHVLSEDRILPVVITDTQVEYKKYITDNGTPQPINYTIQVESSQKREIR